MLGSRAVIKNDKIYSSYDTYDYNEECYVFNVGVFELETLELLHKDTVKFENRNKYLCNQLFIIDK